MIRVLIADDQDLVRAGFRMILDATDGIDVVGEADNGRDAVTKAQHLRPDVCLFDIRMPELDGLAATALIAGPDVAEPLNVVVITTFDLDEYVYGALQAGAIGFLLKNAAPELLVAAVRAAANGDSLISPEITTRLLDHVVAPNAPSSLSESPLTDRETEVVAAVARGLSNAEVATELHVSVSTVKAHIAAAMSKLDARNRVELVIWAYEHGLSG
ncbi:response regulator transcription factor [Ilumatobacter coccineus]|jgi:DNA-binding NarL/FixJ family response regulator|uniref:Putative NarL family two-component response regulator n=1 Tax=Ilumatobacter coccineus (strain NBRC 103263 / KCTC 29153 / YM16-304) TaxID=1313172 RepID=A0A6C7E1X6_ILUCY|nr:response regulator transcription factor [Ilumatobacter coccineus]BAN00853.1 putative NarL family two-component response regulator [Ilumatobacter coccineus YM16-304]